MPGITTPIDRSVAADRIRQLRVDVKSTSKPEPGTDWHTYLCDADIRVTEGDQSRLYKARLTVHHPRGWMGIAAGFDYAVDAEQFPTFEARADYARRLVLEEFPSNELISVFLLGTGEVAYGE